MRTWKPYRSFARATLCAGILAVLGGCQTLNEFLAENAPKQPTTKRLQLQAMDYIHEVRLTAKETRMSEDETVKLLVFLNQHARAARYTIFVWAGTSLGGMSDQRADVVRDFLDDQGFNTRLISMTGNAPTLEASHVKVQVRRYTVTVPGCPNWTADPTTTSDNIVHSNWSCANTSNLGLMVANPADLNRGRVMGTADADLLTKRIRDYRKGETKALDPEDIGTVEAQQKTGSGQ